MQFTDQQLEEQSSEIARLARQLEGLNKVNAAFKTSLGYREDEDVSVDPAEMTPQAKAMLEEMEKKSQRAQAEAQANASMSQTSARTTRRRGAVSV